jgi:hypothetical protein
MSKSVLEVTGREQLAASHRMAASALLGGTSLTFITVEIVFKQ